MCGLWHGCKYKWHVVTFVVNGGLSRGRVLWCTKF
nr:MAG TPA: hypothetical protein [Caudoviricetes sp.]